MQTHADRRSEQEKSELLVQLQRLPAFSTLPPDTIADIAAASRGCSFNLGDVVFPVDDESRFFRYSFKGDMASFSRDEAALAAFPSMIVHRVEGSNKIEQERMNLMQQRYGIMLQKFSHGSIVGVGALWLPETACVGRLDCASLIRSSSSQDAMPEGVPTADETVAAKGSRVRRTMSFGKHVQRPTGHCCGLARFDNGEDDSQKDRKFHAISADCCPPTPSSPSKCI